MVRPRRGAGYSLGRECFGIGRGLPRKRLGAYTYSTGAGLAADAGVSLATPITSDPSLTQTNPSPAIHHFGEPRTLPASTDKLNDVSDTTNLARSAAAIIASNGVLHDDKFVKMTTTHLMVKNQSPGSS